MQVKIDTVLPIVRDHLSNNQAAGSMTEEMYGYRGGGTTDAQ